MRYLIAAVATLLLVSSGVAAPGDDTIRYYIGKSDVVLSAKLTAFTVERGKDTTTYRLTFTTHTGGVYHGKGPHGQEITVNLIHPGDLPPGEKVFRLATGDDYILFLQKPEEEKSNVWRQVDPWFTVQPFYTALTHKVRQISTDESKRNGTTSPSR